MDMFDRPNWVKELWLTIAQKAISWIDAVARFYIMKVAFCSDFNDKVVHVWDDDTAQMSPARSRSSCARRTVPAGRPYPQPGRRCA